MKDTDRPRNSNKATFYSIIPFALTNADDVMWRSVQNSLMAFRSRRHTRRLEFKAGAARIYEIGKRGRAMCSLLMGDQVNAENKEPVVESGNPLSFHKLGSLGLATWAYTILVLMTPGPVIAAKTWNCDLGIVAGGECGGKFLLSAATPQEQADKHIAWDREHMLCLVPTYPYPLASPPATITQSWLDYGDYEWLGRVYLKFKYMDNLSGLHDGACTLADSPKADRGKPACDLTIGNPINMGTGNKYEALRLLTIGGDESWDFSLHYNSILEVQSSTSSLGNSLGKSWQHSHSNYLRAISASIDDGSPLVLSVMRNDGRMVGFSRLDGAWFTSKDVVDTVQEIVDTQGHVIGWRYRDAGTDQVETYDGDGKLLEIKNQRGRTWTLGYTLGFLSSITDSFGRALLFEPDALNRISVVTDSNGLAYRFSYDPDGNLKTITYPDGLQREFLYGESTLTSGVEMKNALTGIVDENAKRYSSYTYDPAGRAISTEHADGVDRFSLSYTADSSGVVTGAAVTDPLGTQRAYTIVDRQGAKNGGVSVPGGSGCAASTSSLTYNNNGNVTERTDFNGNVTSYSNDLTRNLETQRIEASGKPEARTISTQWHSYWRQPVKVAEPKKLTTWTYNGDGGLYCAPQNATVP
ncbi:MAG: RHS repeat protein, partial [Dechloromonas sp.]|nr:RHS repeat protein [Dechloromonas sp.]